jgi:hypothetical protein
MSRYLMSGTIYDEVLRARVLLVTELLDELNTHTPIHPILQL